MLFKNSFFLRHLFCNVEFEFGWFHNTKQSSEILILKIEMMLEFHAFWIRLKIVRYRFLKYRFVRYTYRFVRSPVSILFLFIVSSRRLQGMSSRLLQDMPSRRLQDVFSVTIFRNILARRLEDVLEDIKLLRWRRAEDVLLGYYL